MARLSPAAGVPWCSRLALSAAGLWALTGPLWAGHRGGGLWSGPVARSPGEGEVADRTWAQLLEPLAPGTRLLRTVPLAVCGDADVEGSRRKGRPQLGRGAHTMQVQAASGGRVRPRGRCQDCVSLPPTSSTTWRPGAPLTRLGAGGPGSSPTSAPWPLASAMVALGTWVAKRFASASCPLCQPPGLSSPACGHSLPHTEREAVWTDPRDRWGSAVRRLLRPLGSAAPGGGLREREARPPPILRVSPLFVVPGGEAGMLVLGPVGGGRPRASVPSWPSPGPSQRRCHRGDPLQPPGHMAAGCRGGTTRGCPSGLRRGRTFGVFYPLHIWKLPCGSGGPPRGPLLPG